MIIKEQDFDFNKYLSGEYGGNVIINGSSRNIERFLPKESVQCTITSPPFGDIKTFLETDNSIEETTENDLYKIKKSSKDNIIELSNLFMKIFDITKNDGTLWLNSGDSYNEGNWVASILRDKGWYWRKSIILRKEFHSVIKHYEFMFLLSKSYKSKYAQLEKDNKTPVGDILNKTKDLIYKFVCSSTDEGDIVLDPFGLENIIGKVTKEIGRNSISIELNPELCIRGDFDSEFIEKKNYKQEELF